MGHGIPCLGQKINNDDADQFGRMTVGGISNNQAARGKRFKATVKV